MSLAQPLLWTQPPAHLRHVVRLVEDVGRAERVAMFELPKRGRDVVANGTGDLTRRRRTLDAALRLHLRRLDVERKVYLAPVENADARLLLGDLLRRDAQARLSVYRRAVLRLRHVTSGESRQSSVS